MTKRLASGLLAVSLWQGTAQLAMASALGEEEPLRALILTGQNNHDWRSTTPFLRKLLLDGGRFDVRVLEEPSGATARTFDGYSLLVLNYQGPRWGAETEAAVEEFVASGGGMVAVHGASYAFSGLEILGDRHVPTGVREPAWVAYAEMAGGVWSKDDPATGHGLRHTFEVRFADRDHPVTRGLGESVVATDELYHHMRMQPGVHVLATAYSDPATLGTGSNEPILWAVAYGQGRVFHTTLGHDLAAMQEPGFATTFVRGAEWAASGAVSALAGLPGHAMSSTPLRVLVVTGGHDYETSFYKLFEGYPDLTWDHAVSNREAFSKDIRDPYQVLVLYDMSRQIGEKQRQNLRRFVESGKGIVLLHHAIADYNDWPWWYQEVVGGRYLLDADGSEPASTFQHGEEMLIEPAHYRDETAGAPDAARLMQTHRSQHPITRGVGPLHLLDETYQGMWISPSSKILLRTDNPTSDGPVAWISAYEKSRVVYIQPGHDRETHLNAGYRALVHRAILWAANRLD